jgi:23S rRNA (uridine2552-2'-O)-methyltransferase
MSGRAPGRSGSPLSDGKTRTASSRRWLERQLRDPYVAEAKRQGYRSRAAFKLIEIDDRHHLLRSGARVIDLGAAPGGWSQVAAARVGTDRGRGRVVAVDLLEMDPIAGVCILQADFEAEETPDRLARLLGGLADAVLSDMAPAASGHAAADHLRIIGLAELAFDFAYGSLAPGGAFVCKLWQGGAQGELLIRLKRSFSAVRHVKPPASRPDSRELYVVALGFRGPPA